jgi:hypothetical protein
MKCPDNHNETLYVDGSWTINDTKYHIQSKTGIPRREQLIYFGSPEKQLEDPDTLDICGVVPYSQIRVAPL